MEQCDHVISSLRDSQTHSDSLEVGRNGLQGYLKFCHTSIFVLLYYISALIRLIHQVIHGSKQVHYPEAENLQVCVCIVKVTQ